MSKLRRRDVLVLAGAAIASPALARLPLATSLIRPPALGEGDLVSVVACSSPYEEATDFDQARAFMESLRFKVEFGVNATQVSEIFAGTDQQRADDFNKAVADPRVKAIMLLRGGYGLQRILDKIDYEAIRRNPKVIIGYSDVTALLVAISKLTGVVCFHGPVAASAPADFSENWFRHVVGDPSPAGALGSPEGASFERVTINPGKATGRFVGGNLTMLSTTLGTPYEVDARDALLVIEDIGEAPYRVDRMLTQLRLAGKFKDCKGVVVGQFTGCEPKNPKDPFTWQRSLTEILQVTGKPAVRGFAIGHVAPKLTIPFGCLGELDADAKTLTVLEPAVSPRAG